MGEGTHGTQGGSGSEAGGDADGAPAEGDATPHRFALVRGGGGRGALWRLPGSGDAEGAAVRRSNPAIFRRGRPADG